MAKFNEDTVRAWIADDPDATTRAELETLLERAKSGAAEASEDLADRFAGTLKFGTAGLRGRLGAGPNRMNRAVVIRAAAGLTQFLLDQVGEGFHLVVGYDARYGSEQFALDTAAVAVAAGGRVSLFDQHLPTPLTAFALKYLDVDAAVMVTASHNPPKDNGYKVYLGGRVVTDAGQGAQIVPPYDAQIFEAIQAVDSASAVERAESGWELIGSEIVDAYLDRATSLLPPAQSDEALARSRADLKIVLTSMHGVGGETTLKALARAGFTDVHVVEAQHEPDPDFPTVPFPNPEEPGALDLSFKLARKLGADIILANDPDADRFSAAVPDPRGEDGWRQLTGDEVGALLGTAVAREYEGNADAVLANSIVSSRLLSRIAKHYGVSYRATLTGFKWISRTPGIVFGYEEALGYCVDPDHVRDKDGISACLKISAMASQYKAAGRTLVDALDDFARAYGLHATAPLSIRVSDLSLISKGMQNLRAGSVKSLGGSPVISVEDLSDGSADLPPTDGLIFLTERGDRVVARPSGTEPKLKCYLETIVPIDTCNSPEAGADSKAGGDARVGAGSKAGGSKTGGEQVSELAATVDEARDIAASRLEAMKADMRAGMGI